MKRNRQHPKRKRITKNKKRRAMKLKYIYTLLTLTTALYFVPADAQTKHKAKKPAAKTVAKPAAKKPAPKVVKATTPAKKNAASLGDLVSKAATDTTKKGANGISGNL